MSTAEDILDKLTAAKHNIYTTRILKVNAHRIKQKRCKRYYFPK